MEQPTKLRIVKLLDDKTQFTDGFITITVCGFYNHNDKNYITEPQKAKAHFYCQGEYYAFQNTVGVTNVEDWYNWELLPKLQMLLLLSKPLFV